MRISLDWLTVKLNPDFTLDSWRSIAGLPVIDVETGEQLGIRCADRYWRFNRYGGEDYISAFGAGTDVLAEVAAIHELRVSRIDVAVDKPVLDPEKGLEELESTLNAYYDGKGINITRGTFDGRAKAGKGNRTLLYGKRSSAYQIRAYTRDGDGKRSAKQYVRCEFQLRSDLAKAFWAEVEHAYTDPLTLRNATGTLSRTIFGYDILQVADIEADSVLELPIRTEMHNREKWVRTDVLKACVRHYYETGVDLTNLLATDFKAIILSKAVEALENDPAITSSPLEAGSTGQSPMNYTGSRRAEVALKKYFSD